MNGRPRAVAFRPDPQLRERLVRYAEREHRNVSQALTVLLIKALDEDDQRTAGVSDP